MRIGDTCDSLTEDLARLYELYGEEQIIASLRNLLMQDYVSCNENDCDPYVLKNRADELDKLSDEWCDSNPEM